MHKAIGNLLRISSYQRDPVGGSISIARHDGWQDLYAYEWDYDAAGNRSCQVFNGVATYYSYNEANELTEETEDGATIYYLYDHCGNTAAK